jgi:hypothetical protein
MRKNIAKIPFRRLQNHFRWAMKYGLTTFWYSYLKEKQVLDKYFFFLTSPRFFRISEGPERDLRHIVPLRTSGMLYYRDDGRTVQLEGSIRKITIKDEAKIFVYKRSCGKHTLMDIAREAQRLYYPEADIDMVIKGTILPFYRMLEKNYYMNFYE